jgi:hypothetical protein
MGSKITALIALVAGFAALGDVIRNPQGSATAFNGFNSLLATGYNAAGGYQATNSNVQG